MAEEFQVYENDKFENYLHLVKEIQATTKCNDFPTMGDMLRLPDIFTAENESNDAKLKTVFIEALKSSLLEMNKIRKQEGKNIQTDLKQEFFQKPHISKTFLQRPLRKPNV